MVAQPTAKSAAASLRIVKTRGLHRSPRFARLSDGPAGGGGDRNRCPTPNTVCIERSPYPIRKVTTPVPVEGGVAGGALAMSAGTSFQGRRKPKGSACHRWTMWPVQQAPQHRVRAMSPLKSWLVEKPQLQR